MQLQAPWPPSPGRGLPARADAARAGGELAGGGTTAAEDELVRVTTAKEKLQVWSVAGFRQQQHCCFAFLFLLLLLPLFLHRQTARTLPKHGNL